MSIIIGLKPLTKHSTAITIRISPIRRIITLLPVSPIYLFSRVDARRIKKVIKVDRSNHAYQQYLLYQRIRIFHQHDTVGDCTEPQSIGMASGVIEISFTYVFTSSSFSFALE